MKTELFLNRHIGPRQDEIKIMLNSIGLNSIEELIDETIPKNIRLNKDIQLEPAMSESDYLRNLKKV